MVAEIVLLSLILAADAFWLVFAIVWNKKNFVKQLHHRGASFAFLALQLFLIPLFITEMKNPVLVGAFVTSTAALWLFSLVFWAINFFYCIYLKGNVLVKRTLFRKTEIVLTEEGTFFKQGSDGIPTSRPAAFFTSHWWWITVVSADGSASISFSVRHAEGDGQALLRKMETLVPEYVGAHYQKKGKFKITKKVLRDSIIVSIVFNSGKRKTMPVLNKAQDGGSYHPHFVVDGTSDYLGVEFIESDLENFDQEGFALVRMSYLGIHGVDYSKLVKGAKFSIMEGSDQVGHGVVTGRPDPKLAWNSPE